ncbi:MAG TPA: gfo/Idh/MocA family oxidoreductase, partial [Bacillota bacterium]|nr:gfo/Idh/MocA family oxidoreductase [Bacillota bacterium]
GVGGAHTEICRNFTDHILKGTPLIAPGEEGIRGLSISNAMMLSTWKNDWVDLPIDDDEFYTQLMERVKTSKLKDVLPTEVADLSGTYNN